MHLELNEELIELKLYSKYIGSFAKIKLTAWLCWIMATSACYQFQIMISSCSVQGLCPCLAGGIQSWTYFKCNLCDTDIFNILLEVRLQTVRSSDTMQIKSELSDGVYLCIYIQSMFIYPVGNKSLMLLSIIRIIHIGLKDNWFIQIVPIRTYLCATQCEICSCPSITI